MRDHDPYSDSWWKTAAQLLQIVLSNVSSNEAQHILIQKSLTQQALIAISPAG
jgi:hypothetical protein